MSSSVKGEMKSLKQKPEFVGLFKKVMFDIAKSKAAEHKKEGQRFAKKLKELREEREKVVTSMINDPNFELLSREEWLARKKKIDGAIEEVQVEQAAFQSREISVQRLVNEGLAMLENPAATWEVIKAIEPRVEFQRRLFPKGIEWDGEKCRTPKLLPSLEIIRKYGNDKSRLVASRGIEPLFSG